MLAVQAAEAGLFAPLDGGQGFDKPASPWLHLIAFYSSRAHEVPINRRHTQYKSNVLVPESCERSFRCTRANCQLQAQLYAHLLCLLHVSSRPLALHSWYPLSAIDTGLEARLQILLICWKTPPSKTADTKGVQPSAYRLALHSAARCALACRPLCWCSRSQGRQSCMACATCRGVEYPTEPPSDVPMHLLVQACDRGCCHASIWKRATRYL